MKCDFRSHVMAHLHRPIPKTTAIKTAPLSLNTI